MHDKEYKSVTLRLGFALFLMLVLARVLMPMLAYGNLLFAAFLHPVAAEVLYWSLYNIIYFAIFMLPVPFFILISGKKSRQNMQLEMRFPRHFVPMALVSVGMIMAAARINSLLLLPFSGNGSGDDYLTEMLSPDKGHMMVLVFMMYVIVPPLCEEILFRGLVLGNLLPYGKGFAVASSALLFAAMHQSFSQFLYTAVAGLLMGLLYVQSKSIWPCILVHMLNNCFSFFQTVVFARVPDELMAGRIALLSNLLIVLAGAISLAVLAYHASKQKKAESARQSLFGAPHLTEQPVQLSTGVLTRSFFSPTIIVYLCLCVAAALIELL